MKRSDAAIRQDILTTISANGLSVPGELWITLVFMTREQLVAAARDLNIRVEG